VLLVDLPTHQDRLRVTGPNALAKLLGRSAFLAGRPPA
jgi:hypothetical protein